MTNMLDKMYTIGLLLLCITCCQQCAADYIKGGDNKAISNYEKMIFDKSITTAEFYPQYKEITVKVMKMPVKSYELRYHFNISGRKYEGSHTQTELPNGSQLQVYYLKEDPNFNSIYPETAMKAEKEKNSSKKNLYWAIGWGFLGFLSIITLFDKEDKKVS